MQIVDPIVTILFSVLIVFSVVKMLSKSTHVLLEGTPENIDTVVRGGSSQPQTDGWIAETHTHYTPTRPLTSGLARGLLS